MAIRENPGNPEAYNNGGVAFKVLGQFHRALDDYDAAIDLDPTCTNAYYNRGNAHFHLEAFDSALLDFEQAIRLDATLALAYAGRALVFTQLGQDVLAWIDSKIAVALGVQREILEAEIKSIKSKRRDFGLS